MKIVRLMCVFLLAVSLAAVGCGSSDGGSSSSSSGVVATAFVKSGTAVVKTMQGDEVGTMPIANGRFDYDLPGDIARPFVIEVKDAILSNGQPLQSALSRVVEAGDELTGLHITAFSTIRARAFVQTLQETDSLSEARKRSDVALKAVLDGMGLVLEGINADTILNQNPAENPDLEFAQQSLFMVLGVEDATGLGGVDEKLREYILNPVGTYNHYIASDFVDLVNTDRGKTPAEIIADVENRKIIDENVQRTFEEGKSLGSTTIGGIDGYEAVKDLPGPDPNAPASFCVDISHLHLEAGWSRYTHVFYSSLNGSSIASSLNGTATGGLLLSNSGSGGVASFTGKDWNKVYVIAPDDIVTGQNCTVTLVTNDANAMTWSFPVEIVADDAVCVSDLWCQTEPYKAYLGFTRPAGSEVETYVPRASRAVITKASSPNSTFAPSVIAGMGFAGKGDGIFNLILEAPEGVEIIKEENSDDVVSSESVEFALKVSNGSWALADAAETGAEVSPSGLVSLLEDIELIAVADLPFEEKNIVIQVQDNYSKAIVAGKILPFYILNNDGKDLIGEIGPLEWDGTVATHVESDTDPVDVELETKSFTAEVKSWEAKTGVTPAVAPRNADGGKLLHLGSADGGFLAAPSELVHEIEIPGMVDLSSGTFSFDATGQTLRIIVGDDSSNSEKVSLKLWYENPDSTGTRYESSSQTAKRFESNSTAP